MTGQRPASTLARQGRRLWRLARNPIEGAARVRERFAERSQGWRPEDTYEADRELEAHLHELIGAEWPCAETPAFQAEWTEIVTRLAQHGMVVGRGAYGGWDDADPALARIAWCLVRHRRPETVVETGVGRGLMTATILAALERNDSGLLWSVDLPPALAPSLRRQTGAAVPQELTKRWTYVSGSSRRRLPPLTRELETIDLFVHDSMHTTRNVLFELETAWAVLRPGGAILVDDVSLNRAFAIFTRDRADAVRAIVGRSDDGERLLGVIVRP
jgi:predicted O-methyltransferase YrrM